MNKKYTVTFVPGSNDKLFTAVDESEKKFYFEEGHLSAGLTMNDIKYGDIVTFEPYRESNRPEFGSVTLVSKNQANENRQLSDVAKADFVNFLNSINKPFIPIEKTLDKTCTALKKSYRAEQGKPEIHMPDFLVCNVGLGTIAVDVMKRAPKEYGLTREDCITISKGDYIKSLQFHREFCFPWWFAAQITDGSSGDEFYWLSLFDFDEFYRSEKEKEGSPFLFQDMDFIAIPLQFWRTSPFTL